MKNKSQKRKYKELNRPWGSMKEPKIYWQTRCDEVEVEIVGQSADLKGIHEARTRSLEL